MQVAPITEFINANSMPLVVPFKYVPSPAFQHSTQCTPSSVFTAITILYLAWPDPWCCSEANAAKIFGGTIKVLLMPASQSPCLLKHVGSMPMLARERVVLLLLCFIYQH